MLYVSGSLVGTRWSREHIAWMRSPRGEMQLLYRDLMTAKAEVDPYRKGQPHFDSDGWVLRVGDLDARVRATLSRHVGYWCEPRQRFVQQRIESLADKGGDPETAAALHTLINERLDLVAQAMKEPGLD